MCLVCPLGIRRQQVESPGNIARSQIKSPDLDDVVQPGSESAAAGLPRRHSASDHVRGARHAGELSALGSGSSSTLRVCCSRTPSVKLGSPVSECGGAHL
jgi:hypothetical protein